MRGRCRWIWTACNGQLPHLQRRRQRWRRPAWGRRRRRKWACGRRLSHPQPRQQGSFHRRRRWQGQPGVSRLHCPTHPTASHLPALLSNSSSSSSSSTRHTSSSSSSSSSRVGLASMEPYRHPHPCNSRHCPHRPPLPSHHRAMHRHRSTLTTSSSSSITVSSRSSSNTLTSRSSSSSSTPKAPRPHHRASHPPTSNHPLTCSSCPAPPEPLPRGPQGPQAPTCSPPHLLMGPATALHQHQRVGQQQQQQDKDKPHWAPLHPGNQREGEASWLAAAAAACKGQQWGRCLRPTRWGVPCRWHRRCCRCSSSSSSSSSCLGRLQSGRRPGDRREEELCRRCLYRLYAKIRCKLNSVNSDVVTTGGSYTDKILLLVLYLSLLQRV